MFTIISHAQQMFGNKEKQILQKDYRGIHQDFLIPNIKPNNGQNWEQQTQAQTSTVLWLINSTEKITEESTRYLFTIG